MTKVPGRDVPCPGGYTAFVPDPLPPDAPPPPPPPAPPPWGGPGEPDRGHPGHAGGTARSRGRGRRGAQPRRPARGGELCSGAGTRDQGAQEATAVPPAGEGAA